MSEDRNEATARELLIAKYEGGCIAEEFYERHWPFHTDEMYAQYEELQYLAVITLAEYEQFRQQDGRYSPFV